MKKLRFFIFGFLILAGFLVLVVASFLGYLSYTDYKPAPRIQEKISGKGIAIPKNVRTFSLLSWNVGYCGLGKEMDFFYDGGKQVRPLFDDYQRYLNGILTSLSRLDTMDFIMLQEVDKDSKRSYNTDQEEIFSGEIKDFCFSFATNYEVKFIPFPILSPMSKVLGGQLSMSRFQAVEATRIASPSNFSWPKRLFFLDRCFLLSRFPLGGDTSLVVINIHNSAWTEGAELRKAEMNLLKKTILQEFSKGNFVVVGGDWNQNPPGFNPPGFARGDKVWLMKPPLDKDFLPENWQWAFDASYPSNRDISAAYDKGKTLTTVIDFFLLSPNIKLKEVKTLDNGFENSDHNPVYLSFSLEKDSLISAGRPVKLR